MNSIKDLTLNQLRFWEAELVHQQAARNAAGVRAALDRLYLLPVDGRQLARCGALRTVLALRRSGCALERGAAVAIAVKWRDAADLEPHDHEEEDFEAEDGLKERRCSGL